MMENTENKGMMLSFAAIDQYISSNIVAPTEKVGKNDIVEYGTGNAYPQYIYGLFENVPSLRSVIFSYADYVGGDNINITLPEWQARMNDDDETIEDICRQMAIDLGCYGGFALEIIRNKAGKISQIYNVDLKNLRSNKKNKNFYYSKDWTKGTRCKYLTYPKFSIDGTDASSIFFYKNDKNKTYPTPIWGAATKSAETEKLIAEYHLNNICNGFSGSYIVNFNNGKPTDAQKEEIEENMDAKFGGVENAGRMVICYNDNKENETTITSIPQTDFADKYDALRKSSKQEIFTAFRMSPVLAGIPTEGNGFSDEDFKQAFELFKKTTILPAQKAIKRTFEKIFGVKDVISIDPFTIDFDNNKENNGEVE